MITVVGKDQKVVTVIKKYELLSAGYYVYILSDYVECDEDATSRRIGWFHSGDLLEEGICYMLVCREYGNYELTHDNQVTYIVLSSDYGMPRCYKDIMEMHHEINEKNSRILDLEADLELYKSTKEFIEECKGM